MKANLRILIVAGSLATGLLWIGASLLLSASGSSAQREPEAVSSPGGMAASSAGREKVFARAYRRLPEGTRASRIVLRGPPAVAGGPDPAHLERVPPGWEGIQRHPRQDEADTLWIDREHDSAIPEEVAVTGQGLDVIAGWWLNNDRASHYLTEMGPVPSWTQPMNSLHQVPVGASYGGEFFCTSGSEDSLYGFTSAGTMLYDLTYPPFYEGRRVATSDSANVVISAATRSDTTRVTARQALTGDSLWTAQLMRPVTGIDISSDGLVAAVSNHRWIHVFEGLTGALRDSIEIPGESPWPPAISGDGALVAVGGFTPWVRLFEWNGSSYDLRWEYDTEATYVSAVDVSDDGSTVLAGTFTNSEPPFGQVVMFDAGSPSPLWIFANYGDLISSVSLSSHGFLGAAASWGRQAGSSGYVLTIFERVFWYPLVYFLRDDDVEGVGSILDLELSDDGAYCVAGAKAVHARELGNGGAVIAITAETVGVEVDLAREENAYRLGPNRPNPANPATVIPYRAPPEGGSVELVIFDVHGRRVRGLVRSPRLSGPQETAWDGLDDGGRPLPSGVYFCHLRGEAFSTARKILLAR